MKNNEVKRERTTTVKLADMRRHIDVVIHLHNVYCWFFFFSFQNLSFQPIAETVSVCLVLMPPTDSYGSNTRAIFLVI